MLMSGARQAGLALERDKPIVARQTQFSETAMAEVQQNMNHCCSSRNGPSQILAD
jgi:hypothetical protein